MNFFILNSAQPSSTELAGQLTHFAGRRADHRDPGPNLRGALQSHQPDRAHPPASRLRDEEPPVLLLLRRPRGKRFLSQCITSK